MRLLSLLPLLLFAGLNPAAQAADARPFELGVIPYLPTGNLVTLYQPLRAHFEAKLQRPVALTTAPDFVTFLERCLRKEYDAIVLGPGLGRFLQVEAGYQPLAVTKRNIKALLVVKHDAPYGNLKDLSGKRISMLDPVTGLSQLGVEVLRSAGMLPERDYHVQLVKSPGNALHSVLQGEAEAGVITANLVPQLDADTRRRMRILAESRQISGIMFMLNSGDPEMARQVQGILLQFGETEAGRNFMQSAQMDGLRIPGKRELRALDGFLPEIRKNLRR
jgi:ABC-type phosphate/phosphonate transport system substrate-binding protein